MKSLYKEISWQGLWTNNGALVQLLGLCPLLAISNSAVNAFGLGLATILVLVASNLAVSSIRQYIQPAIRLPVFVLIIASFTTCAELIMQAFTYELYQSLGIFIPLIVTNCIILGRAEAFASRNPPFVALLDGFMTGLGFALVLFLLGCLRELFGTGQVFANMELLLPFASNWTLSLGENYPGFLLAILPPGAFIFMGLLIALKNSLDQRISSDHNPLAADQNITGSKRVRISD